MRVSPLGQDRPAGVRDGLAAAAFAVVSLLPALEPYGLVLAELPAREPGAFHVALVLLQTLPLALRRRLPASALATVGLAFALDQSLGYPPSPAGLGILFALYSAGAHQRRGRRLTIVLGAAGYVGLAVVLALLGSREHVWEFVTFGLLLAAAWGVGDLVRLRGATARGREEESARSAVAAERARLASELHDVVTHHVTGMVVQADAAAFLLPAEEQRARAEFAAIADAGRRALVDLRRLLDVLGTDSAPTSPPIGAVRDLAAAARASGQLVELHESGAPLGTDEARVAVYRIVQEGLTNARKHAPGGRTRVTVSWAAPEAHVEMATSPSIAGRASAAVPGSGRGLPGVRERVGRLGGSLRAGRDDAGWFVLEADIPTGERVGQHGE